MRWHSARSYKGLGRRIRGVAALDAGSHRQGQTAGDSPRLLGTSGWERAVLSRSLLRSGLWRSRLSPRGLLVFGKLTAPCPVAVCRGDSTEVAPIHTFPRARVLLKPLADRGALDNAAGPTTTVHLPGELGGFPVQVRLRMRCSGLPLDAWHTSLHD
jgi:hypothetical protein